MNRLHTRAAAIGALAVAILTTPAQAGDSRLISRLYDPDAVVRIEGKAGVQASIAFDEDEHIENVAIGDSNSWQVTPNKRANLLFVKPLAANARTNLTVLTDRHAYYFDLVASPGARPLYVLRFTYPQVKDVPRSATAPSPALTEAESALAAGDPAAEVKPAEVPAPRPINREWARKGKARLLPADVHDDGEATFLSWRPGTPIPAILTHDATGTEGPVNFAVRDDVIVIDGVPGAIILRWGKDMAMLERMAVPAVRISPASALAAANPEKKD